MENCWTCGTEVSGHHFTCNVCDKTRTNLLESPRVSKSTTLSKFIEYSIADLFLGKEDTQLYVAADISSTLKNIASTIEWGFEELNWRMEQMTAVLQSIDHSLKTTEETKANEQRLMAEELRRRGVFTDSEKLFLKSLELNPLDYWAYVGLAQTNLQMNKFDEAEALLLKSLPHALENIHKSHAYRLIGRTFFAQNKYQKAVETLELSVKLSPDYALGHYDYAQYCALTGRKEDCINSLEFAITKEPSLFALAQKEENFRAVGEVQTLIERIRPDLGIIFMMPAEVYQRFARAEKDLNAAEGSLATLTLQFGKEQDRNLRACHKECERARGEIEKLQIAAGKPEKENRLAAKLCMDRIFTEGSHVKGDQLELEFWYGEIKTAVKRTESAVNKVLDLEKRLKRS